MDRRSFLIAAAVGPMVVATAERQTPADAAAAPRRLPLIGRAAWGAAPPRPGRQRHTPVRLTLHHSGVVLTDDSAAPGRVRQHQSWHLGKGHPDIDYHYVVDRVGHVYEGRDPRYRGDTQTDYDPTGHLLVCCEGDYSSQEPPPAMIRSVALVFAAAAARWDVDPGTLRGHRDYTGMTSCPGGALERLVRRGTLADRIDRYVTRGVTLQRLPAARGRRVVRRITAG